ncbi:MAG: diadenylate cyclase CdaA [Chlamydiales bacterium]
MLSFFHALTPVCEMVLIAIMLNYLLSFFWNTRSMDLVLGLGAFLLIFLASSWFNLLILHKIMYLVVNVAVIAVLVIFQPELRVALSKLSLKGKRHKEMTEMDNFLDQLAPSVYPFSEKRTPALIVIENADSLGEYSSKGVVLNAHFASELLESIFATGTPLHDGAVIIRDRTIVAAAVILPLAEENAQQTKSMGTRHLAALGVSQISDALVVVVSEETGKVSVAREGVMTRGIKVDRFRGIVRSLFTPPVPPSYKEKFKMLGWSRK